VRLAETPSTKLQLDKWYPSNTKTYLWYITSSEYKSIKDLLKLLELFQIVTEVLHGENYTTASITHGLIISILNTLKVSEKDTR
jgi:intein/homing endonuclease